MESLFSCGIITDLLYVNKLVIYNYTFFFINFFCEVNYCLFHTFFSFKEVWFCMDTVVLQTQ